MNAKKIFSISFLITVAYFVLSWLSHVFNFRILILEPPLMVVVGALSFGTKEEAFWIFIGSFTVFWLIFFVLTVLFFLIKNRKTT